MNDAVPAQEQLVLVVACHGNRPGSRKAYDGTFSTTSRLPWLAIYD
jgi:hypothetical protein